MEKAGRRTCQKRTQLCKDPKAGRSLSASGNRKKVNFPPQIFIMIVYYFMKRKKYYSGKSSCPLAFVGINLNEILNEEKTFRRTDIHSSIIHNSEKIETT